MSETYLSGGPLQQINGLTVDGGGYLYAADDGADTIHKIDLTTGAIDPLLTGLPLSAPGRLIVGDGRLLLGTDLVLADWNSMESTDCCDGRVLRIDRATGSYAAISSGNPLYAPGDPRGVALAPVGAFASGVYVMDFMGASMNPPVLFRINDDGTRDVVFSDADVWSQNRTPLDLEFGTTGGFAGLLFVADPSGTDRPPTIWRLSSAGAPSVFTSDSQFARPVAQAFGPGGDFGSDLYVLDTNAGKIFTVDAGAVVSTFASELPLALDGDLVFSADGSSLFIAVGDTIFRVAAPTTAAPDGGAVAGAPLLRGNHPNPFNPATTIAFALPGEAAVTVEVLGLDGRRVRTVFSGRLGGGDHALAWDGRDDHGQAVRSGTYVYRLTSGGHSRSGKMVLLK